MQTNVFDGFLESMSFNIQQLSNDFIPDTTFSDSSSVAKTLQSLAAQVNNLRVFLVDGYHDKFYRHMPDGSEIKELIYG